MKANYHAFVDRMINKYEGGYGWDKADPGGPTKYGITCYDLAAHRGQKMDSMTRWAPIVKAMPLSEAEDIYATKYARAVTFDDDPSGVDCVLMDYGVNSGTGRAIKVARSLLKQPDGSHMDAALLKRIQTTDPKWFINAVNAERVAFMKRIRGGTAWKQFPGWATRMSDLSTYTLALASGVNVAPHLPEPAEPKTAKAHNPERPVVKDTAKVSTGVGAGGGGLWSAGIDPWVIAVFALLIIAGVVGYFIYRNARTRKENEIVIPAHVPPEPQTPAVPVTGG